MTRLWEETRRQGLLCRLRARGLAPARVPWAKRQVPHGLIEVNQTCNIRCDGCYKEHRSEQKPLALIKAEIDLLLLKRNLRDLTFAGGEPTLYPQLPEAIAYARARGLRPMLLTNGYRLDVPRLRALREAGLAEVLLHLDTHQHRPDAPAATREDELNALRKTYAAACREAELPLCFVLTLYRDTLQDLGSLIGLVQQSVDPVRGLLVVCYTAVVNFDPNDREKMTGNEVITDDVVEHLEATKGVLPTVYIASNRDPDSLRWVVYFNVFSRAADGVLTEHWAGPEGRTFFRALFTLQRLFLGRYVFAATSMGPFTLVGYLLLFAAVSLSFRTLGQVSRLLLAAARNGNLRGSSFTFQRAPNQLADGTFEICDACPDATLRDGKLVPVCLADFNAEAGARLLEEPAVR